jgi:iron complex transport system substrate-binding protein
MRYLTFLIGLLVTFSVSAEPRTCARIISMAPSITETLYELGLGDRIVGVTRFCRYPPEAQKIEKIGGFLDVNIEQIVTLKPSHVIALHESVDALQPLRRFGISIVTVDQRSLSGIRESFSVIGKACQADDRASEKLKELERREAALKERLQGVQPLPTLVVVGRAHEGKRLSGVYVSGRDGVYSDILALIGSRNVNDQKTVAVPTLSPEGLLSIGAEAIIEVTNVDDPTTTIESLYDFWRGYPGIPAIMHGRLAILTEDYASIPGPRYILLAERFASVLYPDRFVTIHPTIALPARSR